MDYIYDISFDRVHTDLLKINRLISTYKDLLLNENRFASLYTDEQQEILIREIQNIINTEKKFQLGIYNHYQKEYMKRFKKD